MQGRRTGLLIATINDEPAASHALGKFLEESGFVATAAGYQMRRIAGPAIPEAGDEVPEDGEPDA